MHSICKVAPHWFTCTIFREVLEGDRLSVELDVRPSARAQVTSTGATRLYRSRPEAEPAEFTMYVRAHEGALLEYLPDPLIQFAGSRYRQRTVVNLEHDAGLFWWDTVAPGREARGEVFSYHHLHLSFALRDRARRSRPHSAASAIRGAPGPVPLLLDILCVHLRSPRRWRAAHLRTRQRAAAGPAIFLVLT